MRPQDYLRPSGAANWSRCWGYAQLNAQVAAPIEGEDEDTEVRDDGTACHWLAERRMNLYQPAVGSTAPNGRIITAEMMGAIDEYIRILGGVEAGWAIEQKVPVSQSFPGVQDGTPDAWHFADGVLQVLDLKYGFRFVDAFENLQLTIYAVTIIQSVLKLPLDSVKVRLGIFQPRCPNHMGALRWWLPTADKLRDLTGMLRNAAYQALIPKAACKPHPGCATCPAAYACHALRMAASGATEVAYTAVPAVLDNDRLGYELAIRHSALRRLEAQIAGLETQAEHALRHGERVQGYEMAPRRTLWRWREGAAEPLAALGKVLGVEVTDVKTKSVAQLRALLPKPVVEMYAEKPVGGMALKAIDPKDAERRFNQE